MERAPVGLRMTLQGRINNATRKDPTLPGNDRLPPTASTTTRNLTRAHTEFYTLTPNVQLRTVTCEDKTPANGKCCGRSNWRMGAESNPQGNYSSISDGKDDGKARGIAKQTMKITDKFKLHTHMSKPACVQ